MLDHHACSFHHPGWLPHCKRVAVVDERQSLKTSASVPPRAFSCAGGLSVQKRPSAGSLNGSAAYLPDSLRKESPRGCEEDSGQSLEIRRCELVILYCCGIPDVPSLSRGGPSLSVHLGNQMYYAGPRCVPRQTHINGF